MIPLYAFLEGDTMGIVVLAERADTMEELAAKVRQAASVRVRDDPARRRVLFKGRRLAARLTVTGAGFEPLDRFEVVQEVP